MPMKSTIASLAARLPGYAPAKLAWRRFHDVRPAERGFERERPELDASQRRVLTSLDENGIALVNVLDLLSAEEWNALRADMDGFCASPPVERGAAAAREGSSRGVQKEYLVRRFGSRNPANLGADDVWLRFATGSRVLDIVNSYFGMWSRFQSMDCWYTIPIRTTERHNSQNWHRDPEDTHILKLFLYFRDVDEGAGPFEYIPGSSQLKGRKYGHLWRTSPSNRRYPPSDELERTIPPPERKTCTGPAGTLVFCDTTGFHRGGFATESPRVLGTLMYTSPMFRGREYRLRDGVPPGLSAAARFALS